MYRRLDGARIVETLERLRQRIGERFPGSGLEYRATLPRWLARRPR